MNEIKTTKQKVIPNSLFRETNRQSSHTCIVK